MSVKTSQPNPAYLIQVGAEEPLLRGVFYERSVNFLVKRIPLNPSPSANFVGIEGIDDKQHFKDVSFSLSSQANITRVICVLNYYLVNYHA